MKAFLFITLSFLSASPCYAEDSDPGRQNLRAYGEGNLIDGAQAMEVCMTNCRTTGAGAACINSCVSGGYAIFGQPPHNHNGSDVRCTDRHDGVH